MTEGFEGYFHQKNGVWRCSRCDKGFLSHPAVVKHLADAHDEYPPPLLDQSERKPWPCPLCGQRFLTRSGLASHQRVHLPLPPRNSGSAPKHIPEGVQISGALRAFAEKHDCLCHWCGRLVRLDVPANDPHAPTREHLIVASRGGTRSPDNLVLAHKRCNHLRGVICPDAFKRLMAGEALTAVELWPGIFDIEDHRPRQGLATLGDFFKEAQA